MIMMSQKYPYFKKRKKHLARTYSSHPIEVTEFKLRIKKWPSLFNAKI